MQRNTHNRPEPDADHGQAAAPQDGASQTGAGAALDQQDAAIEALRAAATKTGDSARLWLVGGSVRDRLLGARERSGDTDVVVEGDALAVAQRLCGIGACDGAPVVYPRFGTAMVRIAGHSIELATARKESYADESRRPHSVAPATLEEDAYRRDFTVNTLLENVATREMRDPTGRGMADLRAHCLRTPLAPDDTFADDPLRMLRAVRLAAALRFSIAPQTWDAIVANADRLGPPKVSQERIRDEFAKALMVASPSHGLELLRRSNLLERFAPEICDMVGVSQNEFHSLPVWDHTLLALDSLVAARPHAPLLLRLAVLLHDCGKPRTRSVGSDGRVHFYRHEDVGAQIAREIMTRLKFSSAATETVVTLVAEHMRIGEYDPQKWTDSAVRRLVRQMDGLLDSLFELHRADVAALAQEHQDISRSELLRARIDGLERNSPSAQIVSPLTGSQIMALLAIGPGPEVGRWKEWLLGEVLEGRIAPGDGRSAAERLAEAAAQSQRSAAGPAGGR